MTGETNFHWSCLFSLRVKLGVKSFNLGKELLTSGIDLASPADFFSLFFCETAVLS